MLEPRASGRRRTGKAHGGRPRAADVGKLEDNIIAVAGELFLRHGFDGTSMDAIANKARISKRTLYARHADKSELFSTAIYELINGFLVPIEELPVRSGDLETVLLELARGMVAGILQPEFLAVYRLTIYESQRRPTFGRWVSEGTRRPAVQALAAVLRQHDSELRVGDFEKAAEQFISLTVDVILRLGVEGIKITPDEVEFRLKSGIDLFLNGIIRHEAQHKASNGSGNTEAGNT